MKRGNDGGVVTKMFIWGGAAVLGLAGSASAATVDPPNSTCRDAILGRLCTLSSQANPPSIYGQYGYVEIRAVPPNSINKAVAKTLRKQPLDVIRRLFQDKTVAGLVELKIMLMDGNTEIPIGVVPISKLSSSDKDGIKVSDTSLTAAGTSYFRATPFFKLGQQQYSVKVYISIHSTTDSNSNIAKFVAGALPIVSPFLGVPGALVSQVTQPDVLSKVNAFENQLLGADSALDPNEPVQLAFTSDNAAEYAYELDPQATDRSGFIGIRLRAVPSIFTDAVDDAGKPNFHVQQLGTGVAAQSMLGYKYSSSQTIQEALKATAGATYWDEFRKPFSSEPVYTPPCTAVRDATLSSALGLTAVDALALFWAAYVTGPSANSAAARSTSCLSQYATAAGGDGFRQYALDLPPAVDENGPPDASHAARVVPAQPGSSGKAEIAENSIPPSASPLSKAEYKKFTEIIAFDLRQPPGAGDSATAKKALLGNIFAAKVNFASPMDYDAFLPLDPSPVDQAKMVDVFAALPLKSGCFYRLPDQKTRLFARVIGSDGQPSAVLWHLTVSTVTDGIASHTYMTDLEVRPAKDTDFAAAADILANRPACLDRKLSPE